MTDEKQSQSWAQVGQKVRHRESGRVGVYAEHSNFGEGYVVRLAEGGVIHGPYDAFEPWSE